MSNFAAPPCRTVLLPVLPLFPAKIHLVMHKQRSVDFCALSSSNQARLFIPLQSLSSIAVTRGNELSRNDQFLEIFASKILRLII